jgi:hypothetical protein
MHASPSAPVTNTPFPDPNPAAPPEADNGRDTQGRFARGNPGGPGNPYYRRQAQLKRLMLESVSDADVQSVMQVLLGLARGGDLAAIKLFLEYTVGKPAKEVDPDKEELHEWGLQRQTPRLQEVLETMTYSIETPTANQVTRDLIPLVGDCHLKTIGKHIRDGTDYEGAQIAPPLEDTLPGTDRNGGKRPSASTRRMAAGVRATDPTGDIGAYDEAAWNDRLEEEMARAVQTGDIGALMDHFRSRPHDGASPAEGSRPGSD